MILSSNARGAALGSLVLGRQLRRIWRLLFLVSIDASIHTLGLDGKNCVTSVNSILHGNRLRRQVPHVHV